MVYVPAVEVDGVIIPVVALIVNPAVLVNVPPVGLNVGVRIPLAEHTFELGYDKLGLQVKHPLKVRIIEQVVSALFGLWSLTVKVIV